MNRIVNMFRRWSACPIGRCRNGPSSGQERVNISALRTDAGRRGAASRADGVICGHNPLRHDPRRAWHSLHEFGDWVESCTALAEHEDGRFRDHHLTDPLRRAAPVPSVAAVGMMRILIATDAWHPQVNGVVRTLTMMAEARGARRRCQLSDPAIVPSFAMPSYPDLGWLCRIGPE